MSASLVYLTRLVHLQRTAGVGQEGPGAGGEPATIAFRDHPDPGAPGVANSVRVAVTGVDAVVFQLRDAGNEPMGLPTAVVPENGLADFGFTNPAAGSGYAVSAADVDGRAPLALSGRFDVVAPPVVRTLAFATQPANAQAGAPGTVSVAVSDNVSAAVFRVVDAAGVGVGSSATVQARSGTASWAYTVPPAAGRYRVLAEAFEDARVRAFSEFFDASPAPQTLPPGAFAADGDGAVLTDGDGNLIPV